MTRPTLISVSDRDRAQAEITLQAMRTSSEALGVLATALAVARGEGTRAALQGKLEQAPPAHQPTKALLERVAGLAEAWVQDLALFVEDKGGTAYATMVRASGVELAKRIRSAG